MYTRYTRYTSSYQHQTYHILYFFLYKILYIIYITCASQCGAKSYSPGPCIYLVQRREDVLLAHVQDATAGHVSQALAQLLFVPEVLHAMAFSLKTSF